MIRSTSLLLATLLVVAGCASTMNEKKRDDLRTKAAFDLDCPESELEMTVLKKLWNDREKQIGVTGCGNKATYVIVNGEWIRN